MSLDPQFLDPYEDIRRTNRLPHWQQDGATYFITFRLHDSLPKAFKDRWDRDVRIWMLENPEPWSNDIESEFHRRFSREIQMKLDEGYGSCALKMPSCQEIVEKCFMHLQMLEYEQFCWVIMPNHVHLLTSILPGHKLEDVLQAWKGVTAHRLNVLLERKGTFWQSDYRDTLIRDSKHFVRCVRYIRRNPEKAKLRAGSYRRFECEAVAQVE